jgi:urease accessory protein
MRARARLEVQLDERGRTVPTTQFGEAPLLMRVTDRGRCGLTVHFVGGAAGPLKGDCLTTDVTVGDGATLRVRSVAASLVQPGSSASASVASVTVAVGSHATLDWHPQPLVSVAGSDHVQRTTVAIADDAASVSWIEEIVLGRHGEPSGRLTLQQRFTLGGRPLMQHTVTFDPSSISIGRHGASRVVISVLRGGAQCPGVVPNIPALVRPSVRVAGLRLDDSYTMLIALGDDLDAVRSGLEELAGPICDERETMMAEGHV